jgi:hypothetical protein
LVLFSSNFFVEFSGDIAQFSVKPCDICDFCLKQKEMRHFRETSGIHKVKRAHAITRFWGQKKRPKLWFLAVWILA